MDAMQLIGPKLLTHTGLVALAIRPFFPKIDHARVSQRDPPLNPVAKTRKKRTPNRRKRQNLAGMDFESLVNLRNQVDEALSRYRSTLEEQLVSLGGSVAAFGGNVARGARRSLKGVKVVAKYRGSSGNTWAGRGAKPRWLVAAIKEGGKLEDS
jgi:DNA-binding protein H-NS